MNKIKLLSVLLLFFSVSYAGESLLDLYSPGKTVKTAVSVSANGSLLYSLSSAKKSLIEPSELGIMVNGTNWGREIKSIKLKGSKSFKEKYPLRGKHSLAKSNYIEYEVQVFENEKSFIVVFRLFDDAMAYRYQVDGFNKENIITGELSSFRLPGKSRIWFFERKNNWKLKSYAGEWMQGDISEMLSISPEGPIQGKPLMVELPKGGYLCISEAALENYSGMRLKAIGQNTFQADFTEDIKGFHIKGNEIQTPWRVIMFANNLNQLVNSDVIGNLSPAPDKNLFKDQSYIKPGKAVWSWITKDSLYMKMKGEKEFIDNAQKIGFDYTMIDEGWETIWKDKWSSLKQLCDYAKERSIGVWVWSHSSKLRNASERYIFLDSVRLAGVVGIKVDFMNSEAKEFIDFEIALLKDCAERRLMVNFHGCQSPSGESRTYPNEMTREGVRGMELNNMKEGPITAEHNAALPFTRFLVGHGDYTPGFFSKPGETTWGHQFATMYLFDSPFLCMAENPATIINDANLSQLIPYLKEIPTVWDETVVLPLSIPGKMAAMAKRKGMTWYVIVINGENSFKEVKLETAFLKKGIYCTEIINDKLATKTQLEITERKYLNQQEKLTIPLQANGGFVIKLSEIE